ncbi:MAG: phosphate signaling complex protein PhoU [Pseudomonadota bacterium]
MAETSGPRAHISGQFNAELEAATSHMLEMGGAVERQVLAAVDALESVDSGEAQVIIDSDATINAMEIAIDNECSRILARRQPAAGDLRLVLAITKVIIDLERIGDESSRIARQVIALSETVDADPARPWSREIAATVIEMLRSALDAFARRDATAALAIARGDETIDQQMDAAMQLLIDKMQQQPASAPSCVTAMWALRSLERVGDHARNIAEYAIYMVEGVDVRHTELETLLDWLPQTDR